LVYCNIIWLVYPEQVVVKCVRAINKIAQNKIIRT